MAGCEIHDEFDFNCEDCHEWSLVKFFWRRRLLQGQVFEGWEIKDSEEEKWWKD